MASFWPCSRQVSWHFRPQEQPPTCQTRYTQSASGQSAGILYLSSDRAHTQSILWETTLAAKLLLPSPLQSTPRETDSTDCYNSEVERKVKLSLTKKKCPFCSRPEWVLMPLSLPCFPGLGTYVRVSQSRASRGLFGFRHSCKTFTTILKVLQTTNS